MIVKHLYQRTVVKKGKKVKVWYFWFLHEGKQIRKSCGTSIKRDAMAYIESLKDEDLIPAKQFEKITFNDFCKGMFDINSQYLIKLKNKGIVYSNKTREQKKTYLSYILDRFGSFDVNNISVGIIDDWLLKQNRSNSWRNNLLAVFKAIFDELYLFDLIKIKPILPHYKRIDTKEKGILYPNEIQYLFPDDPEEIIKIWKTWSGETDIQDYIFATMVYTILTTGMRSGEARALKYSQFINEDAILLNAMINTDKERVEHLKKGNDTNKKWRIAILPEKTIKMIKTMRLFEGEKESDNIFEYHGHIYDAEYMNYHFKDVLKKNGIDADTRNITIHSLRFTYNTMMKREISENDLRLMLGHTSQRMTEHYDKVRVLDQLPKLLSNKSVLDDIFN